MALPLQPPANPPQQQQNDPPQPQNENHGDEADHQVIPASIRTSREFHENYNTPRKIVDLITDARIVKRSYPCDRIS